MTTFYVSPTGSDTNPGTFDLPWLTPAKAAQIGGGGAYAGDTILFRGGTYRLSAGLVFSSSHAGQVWQNYPGERPIFSGGVPIPGWVCDDPANDRWVANYTGPTPRVIWANGIRVKQHLMNIDASDWIGVPTKPTPAGTGWTDTSSSWSVLTTEKNPTNIGLVYRHGWMISRIPIASIPANNRITPNAQAWTNMVTRMDYHSWERYPRHIENSWTFFQNATYGCQRGTFYHDIAQGKIYYYRDLDVDMSTAEIIAPVVDGPMVSMPSTYLTFRGITFRHNHWSRPVSNEGFVESQANILLDSIHSTLPGNPHGAGTMPASAIEATDSRTVIEGNLFEYIGTAGITLRGGAVDCVVRGNVFRDLSSNGIMVGDPSQPNAAQPVDGSLITNNLVRYVGQEHWGALPYIEFYPKNTVCEHNDFGYSNYSVTSRGWGWGGTGTTTNTRDNNIFRYNHVHHGMLRNSGPTQIIDGGLQYENGRCTNDQSYGNVLRGLTNNDSHGLYLDDNHSGRTFRDYVIKDVVNSTLGGDEAVFAHNGYELDQVTCDNFFIETGAAFRVLADSGHTEHAPTYTNTHEVTDPYLDGAQIVKMAGLEEDYRHLDDNWEPRTALRAGRTFSGADGRLTKTSFPDISNEGTISFGFLPTWNSGAGSTHVFFTFSNNNTDGSATDYFLLQRYWNDASSWTLAIYYNGAQENILTADAGMFANGKPVIITARWSGSKNGGGSNGAIEVFINGKLVKTYTRTLNDFATTKLTIGNYTSNIADRSVGGRMFDIGLWNVALTDAEIASLTAIHPTQVRRAALTDVWPITNASPEPNLITAGNSLTASGTTAGVSDVPTIAGAPTVPDGLGVTAISETVLRLAWAASTSVQTPTYKVYKSATRWDGYALVGSQSGLTLDNLTPGYWYAVSAVNDAGESGLSPPVEAAGKFSGATGGRRRVIRRVSRSAYV